MEPDPVFRKALENFKKDLTVQQRHEFNITTLQDVKDEVNKIQIQHGSAKKLRGMSRMSKFLEAMQQLEQVISVFLNVSEVVAFIWVASSRLEILECLLDTFTDISEAMPDLQGYASIFKDQPEVLEVLKRCYGDIIQFYHMAFGVLGRPGAFGIRDWRRIFDSVWKTFRTKFSPVLGSLRRHRGLLVQVKLTATYGAVETTRRALEESIEKSNAELKQILNVIQQKKKQVLDKLGGQGSQSDRGHRRLPDQRHPTSGDWILKEQEFIQWLDPDDLSKDLLYLNGMPGAGKTTLVSRIVDSMTTVETMPRKPLLNFYFEHGQSGKILMMDMLRSFIEQLLEQDDDIVDNLLETVLPARPSDLSSITWLENVATRIILAQKRCFIVVDGLDECALDQRKRILQWLKTVLSASKDFKVVMKILVSGQRDGVIDSMLQDCVCTIKLDNQKPHLRDIKNFSSSVLIQIKDRFPELEDEEDILERLDPSRIAEASTGMFMYAKVVLDNFLSQTSIYELEQEVEREYPSGLDEAYDRVAERVLEKTSEPRKQAALQILGLVACAARPLKWREIQCSFCIDTVKGTCDPRRRKVGGPKDLCSSFIESEACMMFPDMPSEAQVVMVHKTAKDYLIRSGRLDIVQQHIHMCLFCFQYLTSPAFDVVRDDSKTAGITALTGFYGFFDYAAAHWDYHSFQYVRQAASRPTVLLTKEELEKPLSTTWMNFVKRFCDSHESLPGTSSKHEVPLNTSMQQFSEFQVGTVDIRGEPCNIDQILRNWSQTRKSTEFETLAKSLHWIMQHTDRDVLERREKTVYLSMNGPFQPKCSRRGCVRFNTGFESEAELSLHISWHEMAYKCPHMGCYAWGTGFRTNDLLQTHLKRIHPAIGSEERLFPAKTRKEPQSLREACRRGEIGLVRTFSIPMATERDRQVANAALHEAAVGGHLAVCVHLTQYGVNPYWAHMRRFSGLDTTISPVQIAIRIADYDLFSALRRAVHEHHEIAFMKDRMALLDNVLDAMESPNPQFLVDLLVWNGRRTAPIALEDILARACVKSPRQEYGYSTLSFKQRRVHIGRRSVQEGLQKLISSELERHRESGQSPELCYRLVLVAPDVDGCSLLHRLCGDYPRQMSPEVVNFLLARLRPLDIWQHDLRGNPPLFTAIENKIHSEAPGTLSDDQASIIRCFFEKDLDGAKNARNAAGHGPLEFAFRLGAVESFSLVFDLCGADYNTVQLYDIFAIPTSGGLTKIELAAGLDRVDERIRMAAKLSYEVMRRFIYLLTIQSSEPEVVKMLQSLILHLPQKMTSAESLNDIPTLSDIVQSSDPRPIKFLLSLQAADRILEKHRPELETLAPSQLRRLFFVSLEARKTRYDVAKILLTQYKLDLQSTELEEDWPLVTEIVASKRDIDPEFVSLLERNGGYMTLSSRESQERVLQALTSNLYVPKKAETQHLDGRKDYVDSLIRYAISEGYHEFVGNLNQDVMRRCLQQQGPRADT